MDFPSLIFQAARPTQEKTRFPVAISRVVSVSSYCFVNYSSGPSIIVFFLHINETHPYSSSADSILMNMCIGEKHWRFLFCQFCSSCLRLYSEVIHDFGPCRKNILRWPRMSRISNVKRRSLHEPTSRNVGPMICLFQHPLRYRKRKTFFCFFLNSRVGWRAFQTRKNHLKRGFKACARLSELRIISLAIE